MTGQTLCCRELTRISKGASPFDRAVVLGWYDGPTDGLVRCVACKRVYRFELLDSVDEDLAGFDSTVSLPYQPNRGIAWSIYSHRTRPHPGRCGYRSGSFPRKTSEPPSIEPLNDLIAQAKSPEFVVTTPGLLEEIDESKAVSASEAGQISDWVSWMGLVRSAAESV